MRPDPLGYLNTELDTLKEQGLFRHLRILDGEQKAKASFDHHQVVNLSSNNYLGLTTHPRLREAALEATRRLGVGSGSVRTIAGTMDIHMELERPPRGVQEDRGRGGVSKRLRRERRHGSRRLIQRRLRCFGRTEPREHHRRIASQPRDDKGVSAQKTSMPRARSSKICPPIERSC
jgi:hypothetical protein